MPEVLILLDAVQAASFITQKKTEELVDKLADLAGSERAKVLKQNIVEFTVAKSSNENILYAVNEISQAILNKKKIYFNYFDYDASYQRVFRMSKRNPEKKRGYKVNPLGTVFDGGYYYLFCYDDFFGGISHYRVDRMDGVKMLEEEITSTAESKKNELSERKRQLFSMFGGEVKRVEFHADRDLIDFIYDKFGKRIKMYELSEKEVVFSADVQISPTFIAWCCSFGSKLKITSPMDVVTEIQRYIAELSENYKEKSSP
ncbi:MAG: WYL domain-containing protein [Clostridia bacterium]|nr:WYL domain-containing protein [Clostridia bacterium]